jgi:NitT/TauT family transport system ATP-binding protein
MGAALARSAHVVLSSVRKSYGEIEAICDASFALATGEFLSVLGPSGCGKSTLLMMLGGLIELSAGEIAIDGMPVRGPRRDVGIVFQSRFSCRGVRSSTTCCSRSRCT